MLMFSDVRSAESVDLSHFNLGNLEVMEEFSLNQT